MHDFIIKLVRLSLSALFPIQLELIVFSLEEEIICRNLRGRQISLSSSTRRDALYRTCGVSLFSSSLPHTQTSSGGRRVGHRPQCSEVFSLHSLYRERLDRLSRILILSLTFVDGLFSHFDRQVNGIHLLSDYHVGVNDGSMSCISNTHDLCALTNLFDLAVARNRIWIPSVE